MRPASDSILSAIARTDVREDRLTEVLACVAHVNRRFAAALVRMAGIEPGEHERYVVGTQRVTSGGRRVDMEIATYRGLHRTGLVWIEVKAGADYQRNQLSDYAAQVIDPVHGEDRGKVLTIIPPDDASAVDTERRPPRWECKSWAQVALAADRLGREWGGPVRGGWRRDAMQPYAPAQWRYLAELVRHLEEKGYARMNPLTPEDVIAAQRVVTLPKAIEDLVKAARDDIKGVTREKGTFRGLKEGCFQSFTAAEPSWFSDPERFGNAYPELLYWHTDNWVPDARDAPAFCAGITLNRIPDAGRYALLDKDWQARLPAEVSVGGGGRLLRVVRTKYLSELVVAGVTLDDQVQALKLWASRAIADIMDPAQVHAPTRRLNGPDEPAVG